MEDCIEVTQGFCLRLMSKEEITELWTLCEACMDYFLLADGVFEGLETAHNILTAVPPGKSAEDKLVFGVRKCGRLVGVVDLVRDFPGQGEWMLGLLLITPEERSMGLGAKIHQELVLWAEKHGAETLRIAVLEKNAGAYRFWAGLGYSIIETKTVDVGTKRHTCHVMRRNLGFTQDAGEPLK